MAEQGTETHPSCWPVPRPCPRAAAPLCTLKAGAVRVLLTPGTVSRAAAVHGQRRFPAQSAELAHETPERRWRSPDPRAWGRLAPTRQTCCLLSPAPLPAARGRRGCVLGGSGRLITQHGSRLGGGFQECSARDPGCQGSPGHLHLCAPETSRHPPVPGPDPRHASTGAPLGKPPRCLCLLLHFPKFLDSCSLIRSDRGKKLYE